MELPTGAFQNANVHGLSNILIHRLASHVPENASLTRSGINDAVKFVRATIDCVVVVQGDNEKLISDLAKSLCSDIEVDCEPSKLIIVITAIIGSLTSNIRRQPNGRILQSESNECEIVYIKQLLTGPLMHFRRIMMSQNVSLSGRSRQARNIDVPRHNRMTDLRMADKLLIATLADILVNADLWDTINEAYLSTLNSCRRTIHCLEYVDIVVAILERACVSLNDHVDSAKMNANGGSITFVETAIISLFQCITSVAKELSNHNVDSILSVLLTALVTLLRYQKNDQIVNGVIGENRVLLSSLPSTIVRSCSDIHTLVVIVPYVINMIDVEMKDACGNQVDFIDDDTRAHIWATCLSNISHPDKTCRTAARFVIKKMAAAEYEMSKYAEDKRETHLVYRQWESLIDIMSSLENYDLHTIQPAFRKFGALHNKNGINADQISYQEHAQETSTENLIISDKCAKHTCDQVSFNSNGQYVISYPWVLKVWNSGLQHECIHTRRLTILTFLNRKWEKHQFHHILQDRTMIENLSLALDNPIVHRLPYQNDVGNENERLSIHLDGLESFFQLLVSSVLSDVEKYSVTLGRLLKCLDLMTKCEVARTVWMLALQHAIMSYSEIGFHMNNHKDKDSIAEALFPIFTSIEHSVNSVKKRKGAAHRNLMFESLMKVFHHIFTHICEPYMSKENIMLYTNRLFLTVKEFPLAMYFQEGPIWECMTSIVECLSLKNFDHCFEFDYYTLLLKSAVATCLEVEISGKFEESAIIDKPLKEQFATWEREMRWLAVPLRFLHSFESISFVLSPVSDQLSKSIDEGMLNKSLMILDVLIDLYECTKMTREGKDSDSANDTIAQVNQNFSKELYKWFDMNIRKNYLSILVKMEDAVSDLVQIQRAGADTNDVASKALAVTTVVSRLISIFIVNITETYLSVHDIDELILSMANSIWNVLENQPIIVRTQSIDIESIWIRKCVLRCQYLVLQSAVDTLNIHNKFIINGHHIPILEGLYQNSEKTIITCLSVFQSVSSPLIAAEESKTFSVKEDYAQVAKVCWDTIYLINKIFFITRNEISSENSVHFTRNNVLLRTFPLIYKHLLIYHNGNKSAEHRRAWRRKKKHLNRNSGFEEEKALVAVMKNLYMHLKTVYDSDDALLCELLNELRALNCKKHDQATAFKTEDDVPRPNCKSDILLNLVSLVNDALISAYLCCNSQSRYVENEMDQLFVDCAVPAFAFCASHKIDSLHDQKRGPINSFISWGISVPGACTDDNLSLFGKAKASLARLLIYRLTSGLLEHQTGHILEEYTPLFKAIVEMGHSFNSEMEKSLHTLSDLATPEISYFIPKTLKSHHSDTNYVRIVMSYYLYEQSKCIHYNNNQEKKQSVIRFGAKLFREILSLVCKSGTTLHFRSTCTEGQEVRCSQHDANTYGRLSPTHRRLIRIWQTLSLLIRFQREQEPTITSSIDVCESVFHNLFVGNLPSVRMYNERILLYIMRTSSQTDAIVDLLVAAINPNLEMIESGSESIISMGIRNQGIASCITCLAAYAILILRTGDTTTNSRHDRRSLLELILHSIIQWTATHNHSIRAAALVAFKGLLDTIKVSEEYERIKDIIDSKYIQQLSRFVDLNPDTKKVVSRVNHLLSEYDPDKALTPEGIFETSGCLSIRDNGMILCEMAPLSLLEHISLLLQEEKCLAQSSKSDKGSEIIFLSKKNFANLESSVSEGVDCVDLQRKIVPVSAQPHQFVKDKDDENENDREARLIIAANLIDKSANLGGIARTCEIFGVDRMLVANLSVTKDSNFSALSVSSQNHINIQEVNLADLFHFLSDMKCNHGYKIVGLEQTINSKSLLHYSFDQKTILLLGNEVYGINADLLNILDATVEIPQLGQIRSLNVHVSAALAIFEWTKQFKLQ